jgi:TatD DNase family protein
MFFNRAQIMELIDTHAHLTFPELEENIDAVVARSIDAGVTSWITVGTDTDQIKKTLALIEKHDNIYAAIGFHPHEAKQVTDGDFEYLKESAKQENVVAIGETGLDFHYDHSPRDVQKEIFSKHLHIASEINLPVVVHTREAFDETLEILEEFEGRLKKVVFHCYSGTSEQTKKILDKGYFVSFTGIVTFKKTDDVRMAAKLVPLERLMIETDCPFISPEPVRNTRPCEPAMLVHTAKKLAEVKEMDLEDFAEAVTATSKVFFGMT